MKLMAEWLLPTFELHSKEIENDLQWGAFYLLIA